MNVASKLTRAVRMQSVPYSEDAPMVEDLAVLSRLDLSTIVDEDGSNRSGRAKIRYLAALFPDAALPQLAENVSAVIDNRHLSLSDMRLILDGRSLADPSRATREVPLQAIQTVGAMLRDGASIVDAADAAGVGRATVRAIDQFLGLTRRAADRQLEAAIDLVREGAPSRAIARALGVSQTTALRLQRRAVEVLTELGEIK